MYTPDYSYGPSNHPQNRNFTSYIIDINGFVIFHGGDSKYIDEYEELTGKIDIAFLALYYDAGLGPLNCSLQPIIDSIEMIQPNFCVPTHWEFDHDDIFWDEHVPTLEDDCEMLRLGYFTMRTFNVTSRMMLSV